ncbi:MAG TPA: hypothetical protein VL126_02850 [Bacteroidota bacterium]|nr:hypothetical protein [Bacteroidota bacterium]
MANAVSGRFASGPWQVEYRAGDGGRLSRIAFEGYDLLTGEPARFSPPRADVGLYESRPVYGYDDCFPSVVPCRYPGSALNIPDHGELCWLEWDVVESPARLRFSVRSRKLPLVFVRTMEFAATSLTWSFEVRNEGDAPHPFLHAMHPLFSVDEITSVEIPEFECAFDWQTGMMREGMSAAKVSDLLLNRPRGTTEMLFLRNLRSGEVSCAFRNDMRLKIRFPVEHFPTLGIWWNNRGYPDEDGIRRSECAFEPTAGDSTDLSREFAGGRALSVAPGGRFSWQVHWDVETGRSHGSH